MIYRIDPQTNAITTTEESAGARVRHLIRKHSRIPGLFVVETRDADGFRVGGERPHVTDDFGTLVAQPNYPMILSLRDGAGMLNMDLPIR